MWTRVDQLLLTAVNFDVTPGCAVCIRTRTEVLHTAAFGSAELRPEPRPTSLTTPWDLASLTKVLATTPIAMRMVAAGVLDLDAPISDTLADAPAGVTAAHCLSHTSGLPAWAPLFDAALVRAAGHGSAEARDRVLLLARNTAIDVPPGTQHRYSDVGFLLLCAQLEAIGGAPIDALFDTHVRQPSGIDLRWGWPEAAATEDCPDRGEVIVGQVHDLNAHAMGGASSHAGLFGPVQAVAAAAAWQLRAWSGVEDEGLRPAIVQQFWSHQGAGSHHLGWDGVSAAGSSASRCWPRDGVGHLGFTGCSIWIAPRQDIVVVICANRVHPVVEGGSIPDAPIHPRYAAFRALRPQVHSAVINALETAGRWPS
jgi:CubicO group peptidase (beta-lactamase class C family)